MKSDSSAVIYGVLGMLVVTPTPNGHLYAALMDKVGIDEWNAIVSTLMRGGMVTQSNYLLSVTPKGRELYAKMDAVVQKHLAATPKPKSVASQIMAMEAGAETTE